MATRIRKGKSYYFRQQSKKKALPIKELRKAAEAHDLSLMDEPTRYAIGILLALLARPKAFTAFQKLLDQYWANYDDYEES